MTNTVTGSRQRGAAPTVAASSLSGSSLRPIAISDAGVDIALLASALFLQRFSLPLGNTRLTLDIVAAAFIFLHQFASGRMLVRYDRLLWFFVAALAVTCALLFNLQTTMLTSYCLFIVLYSLFTLSRPSTPSRYKSTLQAFQFLVAVLSFLAAVQFVAQFVVDGRELVRFFGVFPDILFTTYDYDAGANSINAVNTIIPITEGSSLIKSNGIFLAEPSSLSQVTALGILIEVLEFRRPRYLLLMALGFLLSYSGTGLIILFLFLPLAGLHRRAGLPVLFVIIFAVGLFITGAVDLSAFLSRVGEFEDNATSGFQRFVAPFWLAAEHFDTASLPVLLLGEGPGTIKYFTSQSWYGAGGSGTWIKLFYEYGIIGSFFFLCFLGFCFRKSRCPTIVLAAILFSYVFLGGLFLSTPFLIMVIVLCTLQGPELRHRRIDDSSRYPSSLVARPAAG